MRKITPLLLLISLLSILFYSNKLIAHILAGNGNLTFNNPAPVLTNVTVCGNAQTFTLTVKNISGAAISDGVLTLNTGDAGVDYVAGSVVGATENDITNLSIPKFNLPSIPGGGGTVAVTYNVTADCTSGSGAQPNYRVDYTGGFDDYTTGPSFVIQKASLAITAVTLNGATQAGNNYTGALNETFTRCMTITNGGLGAVSTFKLEDVHGAAIDVLSADKGTFTNTSGAEYTTLSGTDFAAIGDGDNFFEQNEEITVCMQVKILTCTSADANSTIKAFWGCGGSYTSGSNCQQNTVAAGVLFPNAQPNLQIVSTFPNGFAPCTFDGLTDGRLTIRNKGTGIATAVKLALHKYYDMFLAESSFITLRDSATNTIIPIDSIKNLGTGALANLYGFTNTTGATGFTTTCYPNGKYGYYIFLPNIPAGKTYYLDLKFGSCCPVEGSCSALYGGYNFHKIYSNACGIAFPQTTSLSGDIRTGYDIDENYAPTTMSDEQVGTFNWLVNSIVSTIPFGAGGSWDFEFTLGPCLVPSTAVVKIMRSNGVFISPDSYTVSGNTVIAHFIGVPGANNSVNATSLPTPAGSVISNAELFLDVKGDCQASGCMGGSQTVDVKVREVSRPDCACKPVIGCFSANTIMLGCNTNPCPGGLEVSYFDFKRVSYGKPDNETSPVGGNGVPDATGSVDTTKIRTDRAIYGDTLLTRYRGNIVTNAANPTWDSLFAVGSFANGGDMMQFLSATLSVVRGGTTYTCTTITPQSTTTSSGTALSLTRTFTYNLNSAAVAGCGTFPAGFVYQNGDHVKFDPKYKITPLSLLGSQGHDFRKIQYSGRFYTVGADPTDIASPAGTSVGEFQCGIIVGNIYVYDYAVFAYNGSATLTTTGCNTATITSSIRAWSGVNVNAYDNTFPNEYRNYAHIKTVSWVLPTGYSHVNSTVTVSRTAGTFLAAIDYNTVPITPTVLTTAAGLDSVIFNIEALYDFAGGNAKLADEENTITLSMNIVPSCETPVGSTTAKEYISTVFHGAMATIPTNADKKRMTLHHEDFTLNYSGRPVITFQPATATTTTYDNTVTWDIQIQNTTNNATFNAKNLWFGECNTNGVTITKITDLGSSTDLTYNSTSQLYEAGTINGNSTRNFRVYGTFSVCVPDTMYLCAGWNCPGYPDSVEAYSCTVLQSKLTVDPKEPDLQITVTPTDATTINLCGEQTYTITGLNVLQGSAYDVRSIVNLPTGLTIVPGSSKLRYPSPSGSYTTVTDPTDLGSNNFEWDVSTLNSTVGTNGLKGVNSPAEQRQFDLQFQVEAQCGFVSGSNGSVTLKGKRGCGTSIPDRTIPLPPLNLNGAVTPYNSVILLSGLSPLSCTNPNILTINVKNNGPGVFGNADSVFVTLPTGISYNNTLTPLLNAPASGSYKTRVVDGQTVLIWKLPNALANGAISSFNIGLTGSPSTLACGDLSIKVDTRLLQNLICEDDNSPCPSLISTGTATLTISNPAADLNALTDQSICFGKTFTAVTATGTNLECATIQWYNNNGTNNANTNAISGQTSLTLTSLPTAVGSYSYKVVATKGNCKDSSVVNLVINANPIAVASVTSSLTCTTTSIDISGTGSTTTTGTTYGWLASGGATKSNIIAGVTTHSPTVDAAGTYTLTVTGTNGCTATASVSVSSNTTVPNANAGTTKTLTCTTTSIALSGSSSTIGATYGWTASGGATASNITAGVATLTPTVNAAGTYTLTVTGTNGCTATSSVSVSTNGTRPDIGSLANKTITCTNTQVILNGVSNTTGATFAWTGPNGFTSTQAQPTVNQQGTYTLTVTDPNNGCTATASLSVGISNTLPDANAGADKIITCNIQAVQLNGSSTASNVTYTWNGPGGYTSVSQNPTVSNSGTYILTVTAQNGCTATDAVLVTNDTGMSNMTVAVNSPCLNNALLFNISGTQTGYTYAWSGPGAFSSTAQNPQIPNATEANSGTYNVTITGTNGCKVVRTVTATVQLCCTAEAGNINIIDPTLCVGDKIQASTSVILPKLNYDFYYLLVNNQTGIIVEKIMATNNTPITFNTTTAAMYTVYGFMLKTGVGTAPTITVGTTTINDLLAGTNSNNSNYNTPNCYDLSGNNAQINVPSPFSVLAQSGNIYEGNQGGISPFNYTIHEIYVLGGTPPYNYSWSNTNFVKPGIQEATDANHTLTLPDGTTVNGPGTNVEIIYADNATWHLTITDANGCSSTLLVFSNDAGANGQTDTIGGKILDIDNYQIKGNVLNQQNGAVRICVSGGEVGCVPSFQWSGPQSWTNTAPASAPGMTTGTTAPGACGAGTTAYNLTELPTGWYSVTVTCGTQTTEGWYWVPKKRPGRGGKDDLENGYIDAYPNPFSNVTNIGFVSGVTGKTVVNLYSIDGKKMVELYKGETIENEAYTIQLEATNLANGVYIVNLQQADGSTVTQKLYIQK